MYTRFLLTSNKEVKTRDEIRVVITYISNNEVKHTFGFIKILS